MDAEKLAALLLIRRRRKRKTFRRYWVHPLNNLRPTLGEHLKIELMYSNHLDQFVQYTRMTPNQFDKVLSLIEGGLRKDDTNYRLSISPRHRLMVGLRYLVTGDSLQTIATSFSLGRSTVQKIIKEVNINLWKHLSPIYMKVPSARDWLTIVREFQSLWNFPNCLGAVDGKHVMIQAPPNSGSLFFNYKGFFSVVLLATCDANYKFTTVDIGGYGKQSDGGIFLKCGLGKALQEGSLPIPDKVALEGTTISQPCTFVGDDAFALSEFMMKPYPEKGLKDRKKRIFNYRLSRARRIIENVFGIMASRFRIYKRSLIADPDNVVLVIQATTVLHNFLRTEEESMPADNRRYCPPGYADRDDENTGEWRFEGASNSLQQLQVNTHNNYTKAAKRMRDNLADYFVNSGKVNWQDERACVSHISDV